MKKNLSILLFLALVSLYAGYAGAQPVAVELSVCWKKSPDYLSPGKQSVQPYLNISYRNLSRKPVYLLKVTNDRHGFPRIAAGNMLINKDPKYFKQLPIINDFSTESFILTISDIKDEYNFWLISSLKEDTKTEDDDCSICYPLNDIYNLIIRKNYKENIYDYLDIDWQSTVLTPDVIQKKAADRFAFLMPGEVVTDSFNLVAFQMTGGRFTFQVGAKELPNSLVTLADMKLGDGNWVLPERNLPEQVGKFRLYSGTFLTNEVTIYFPGNKTK